MTMKDKIYWSDCFLEITHIEWICNVLANLQNKTTISNQLTTSDLSNLKSDTSHYTQQWRGWCLNRDNQYRNLIEVAASQMRYLSRWSCPWGPSTTPTSNDVPRVVRGGHKVFKFIIYLWNFKSVVVARLFAALPRLTIFSRAGLSLQNATLRVAIKI